MLCPPSALCAGRQLTFLLFGGNLSQGEQAVAVPDDVKVMARWKFFMLSLESQGRRHPQARAALHTSHCALGNQRGQT